MYPHFVRLFLLMAMGLGAMYMMHLLAQDYNKIRKPVAAAAGAARALTSASATLMRGKRSVNHYGINSASKSNGSMPTIDWKRILSRDPFECLQSLICQIMAGAESDTKEALTLIDFLETTLKLLPAKIARAFSRGLALHGNPERCYDEYPLCVYSAKTMIRILNWLSD